MGERYVPAAGHRVLTRFYDPVMATTMRERTFRCALVDAAVAAGPLMIADVGCGTGSQTIALSDAAPHARIIGIDGDPEALDRARSRAGDRSITWTEALAEKLPILLSLLLPGDPARSRARRAAPNQAVEGVA